MCDPMTLGVATAATGMIGGMAQASATNNLSRKNAEAANREAQDAMGTALLQRLAELGDMSRERMARDVERERLLGQHRANFADLYGSPVTDGEMALKNEAMDAEWALGQTMMMADYNAKSSIQSISMGNASRIRNLPTVSVAQQAISFVESGFEGAAMYSPLSAQEADSSGLAKVKGESKRVTKVSDRRELPASVQHARRTNS